MGLGRVDADLLPERKAKCAVLPKAWPGGTSLALDQGFTIMLFVARRGVRTNTCQ